MARRVTRHFSGARRETSWFDIEPSANAVGTSQFAITHLMTAVELAKRPFTVTRTRLEVMIATDQASASEAQIGAVGLCVVSSQAAAIGVTAVPTPISDMGSDLWFVHHVLMSQVLFATVVGITEIGRKYSIDSRAMRKVNDDQEIIVVVESAATSDGFNIDIAGRLLIKEH